MKKNETFPEYAQSTVKATIAKLNDTWRLHQIMLQGIEKIKDNDGDTIVLKHYFDTQPLQCSGKNFSNLIGQFIHEEMPRHTFIKAVGYVQKCILKILKNYHAHHHFFDDCFEGDSFNKDFVKLSIRIRANFFDIDSKTFFQEEDKKALLKNFEKYIQLYDDIVMQNILLKVENLDEIFLTFRNFLLVFSYSIIQKNYPEFTLKKKNLI